jgi:ketopantoate reductase
MEDFQTALLLIAWFITCGAVGFMCGLHLAQPVKRDVVKQLRDEILDELRKQNQENARNAGGFRIVGGRNAQ